MDDNESKKKRRVLWCTTSSGDMIREIVELMCQIKETSPWHIEVAMSKESPFVLRYYKVWDTLQGAFPGAWIEKGPNAPFLGGQIQRGRYEFIIVAPVTGNTMAKIARGIADALVPNCVSLALKTRVPVVLFPTDQEKIGEETILADGSTLKLYPREIDLENVSRARQMRDVTVLANVEEIEAFFLDKANEDRRLNNS